MQSDIATISVITSGLVAIATILLPLFFNFVSDSLKWKRERRLSEIDKIEKATAELMRELSEIWAGNYHLSGNYQGKLDSRQLDSKIFNFFYAWERTLWPYVDQEGSEIIMEIHDEVETKSLSTHDDEGKARQARLSREILKLTRRAVRNVK